MRAKMLERWIALSQRLGVDEKTAQELYHMIVHYYMQPRRYYHTLAHISSGLKELDAVRALARWPDELELAWWFHDAFYETWAEDNELRSAELANFFILKLMGLPSLTGIRVYHLVLPTTHRYSPGIIVGDTKLMIDIDLHELGKPLAEFDVNSANVRKEYWWVPEETYRGKRAEILENFLKRTDIYFTQYFRDKYEKQARENLTREIARLRSAL